MRNVAAITDTAVAGVYAAEFAELFGGTFSNDKTDTTPHSATVGAAPVEIAFAPTDGVEQRIDLELPYVPESIKTGSFRLTPPRPGSFAA